MSFLYLHTYSECNIVMCTQLNLWMRFEDEEPLLMTKRKKYGAKNGSDRFIYYAQYFHINS